MRPRLVLGPLLLASLALFGAAAFAPNGDAAILLALAGSLLPALGLAVVAAVSVVRWKRMARTLGLVPREGGMFPDLQGFYGGRRLVISRRTNPYGLGPRTSTLVRLEGTPDVVLPGLVADAGTIRGILKPLVQDRAPATG